MFDRFVRLTQARRALAAGRPEEALRLLADPLIASQRRTEEVRAAALESLVARAKARADGGDLRGGITDVETVLKWRPEHAPAVAALHDLRQKAAAVEKDRGEARLVLQEVRLLIDAGELRTAEARLGPIASVTSTDDDFVAVRKSVAARRAGAVRLIVEAERALARGEVAAARDLTRQAGALDRQAEGLPSVTRDLVDALARSVADAASADLARGAVVAANDRLVREFALLPELGGRPELQPAQREAAARVRSPIEQHLCAGRLREALAVFAELDARVASAPWLGRFGAGMAALRAGLSAAERGDLVAAVARLTDAVEDLDAPAVAMARDAAAADVAAIAHIVEVAREHVARGDLLAARHEVARGLARWPLASTLHEEMKVLDDSALERQRRLAAARQAALAGRLREACAQALALACPSDLGDEARQLHAELLARIDVVAAGVDQVKRAVHGRGSGSSEGLAHCIARLDELAKVQSDQEHLPRLREALATERRGLNLLRAIVDGCRAKTLTPLLLDDVKEVVALRGDLLTVDRLDARLLEAFDELCVRGEMEVAAGRLRVAQRCVEALAGLATALPAEMSRIDGLRLRVTAAATAAADAVQRGRAALAGRALDDAESALDVARRSANDADEVSALEREIEALRGQRQQLDEVSAMADNQDFARAHELLAGMPPTPAALRTKIFDLKRSLARAQGLDGGFVLRVDEGGEFLVLRRDSLSIGNLRDGRADLVVLANIAGQHARLQRRMSFHGGMEDRVVADRGDVAVNGQVVRDHRLRDGDEIALAGQLRLSYHVPSGRSLTTLLRVLGSFQIRGTDKILLMKDRGRDGRILIGNCKDAHVPVSGAGSEVELFAGLDGQVRVRCEASGTMDGRPFSGEHPVTAGAVVVCGGVAFVLLPIPPA